MKFLITGIAGTWGREFTLQLAEAGHEVVGVDNTEKSVAEFRRDFPEVKVYMEDFGEFQFGEKYDYVIHLAAYKHIDLGEVNVSSCVENNVVKTISLYNRAKENGAKIVFVSTDKAVEPKSVYGYTKALGERLTWEMGGTVIRSGNIIGSNGSVVHIWRDAIKNQRPLKVTDLNMVRYFIRVEDAVKKSIDGILAGDRLTIVDIGGPLTLGQIIENILRESGIDSLEDYKPGIEIIGKRPGERLIDKIRWEEEENGEIQQ